MFWDKLFIEGFISISRAKPLISYTFRLLYFTKSDSNGHIIFCFEFVYLSGRINDSDISNYGGLKMILTRGTYSSFILLWFIIKQMLINKRWFMQQLSAYLLGCWIEGLVLSGGLFLNALFLYVLFNKKVWEHKF